MEIVEIVLLVVVVALVAVVLVGVVRAQRPAPRPPAPTPIASLEDRKAVVVLDVVHAPAGTPAVERMVREAAARVYRMMPTADSVEVRTPSGGTLGVVTRTPPPGHPVELSRPLTEPHTLRSRRPDLLSHLAEPEESEAPTSRPTLPVFSGRAAPGRRSLAERFDLPETVRSALRDENDPVDLVRTILESSGAAVHVEDDLIRVGEYAVMVLVPPEYVVEPEALAHAYLRIEHSGASRGLVIALGILDVADVRRREAFAPHVLHTGPDGVQRMADAVAIGEDPLRFAAGPALGVVAPAAAEPGTT